MDLSEMDDELVDFAAETGKIVLESAVRRFAVEADTDEMRQFEEILGMHGDLVLAMPALNEEIPRFRNILTEEIAAFTMMVEG